MPQSTVTSYRVLLICCRNETLYTLYWLRLSKETAQREEGNRKAEEGKGKREEK
jgi:hypothetical protein